MAKLDKMTSEELEAEGQRLDEAKQDIRAKQLAVQDALGRRAAADKVADLSSEERAELAQALADAGGINSGEAAGTPGADG